MSIDLPDIEFEVDNNNHNQSDSSSPVLTDTDISFNSHPVNTKKQKKKKMDSSPAKKKSPVKKIKSTTLVVTPQTTEKKQKKVVKRKVPDTNGTDAKKQPTKKAKRSPYRVTTTLDKLTEAHADLPALVFHDSGIKPSQIPDRMIMEITDSCVFVRSSDESVLNAIGAHHALYNPIRIIVDMIVKYNKLDS